MPTYSLNIGKTLKLPGVKALTGAFEKHGLPEDGHFGVLDSTSDKESVKATVVYRYSQSVRSIDKTSQTVVDVLVDKAIVYPLGVFPAKGFIEVHAGSGNSLLRIQEFLAECLSSAVTVEFIELDVARALRKLSSQVDRFQLRSVHVPKYAPKSYLMGPYNPTFSDSDHGMDFLEQHADEVTAANVRFFGPAGPVSLTITSRSCFKYSCHEDDNASLQSLARKLL